jgi:hypothetical protein
MTTELKNWIEERKDNPDDLDVMEILKEIDAEVSMDSRIAGTLLTVLLCEDIPEPVETECLGAVYEDRYGTPHQIHKGKS